MEHVANTSFIENLQSMTSLANNAPDEPEVPKDDTSNADRELTIYLVPNIEYNGDAPIIKFGASMNYLFADRKGLRAIERLIDSYAGHNLTMVDTTQPPLATPSESQKASPRLSRPSREEYAGAKRAHDRALSRLAADNFMRWHQLHGYSHAEAQRERDEIYKYLVENGVDPSLAEENLDLLERFYVDPVNISKPHSLKGD